MPPTATPLPQGPVGAVTVIEAGAPWRYFDQGDAPASWQLPGFIDTGWLAGAGEFGFGDGDEVTTITRVLGNRGLHTAYFRAQFDIAPGSTIDAALLQLLADDAAVVWVNGQRVVNDNISAGSVDYWTFANSGRWGSAERTMRPFSLPSAAFVVGTNTIAIEVHQRSEWSSDLSFDASLTLTLS